MALITPRMPRIDSQALKVLLKTEKKQATESMSKNTSQTRPVMRMTKRSLLVHLKKAIYINRRLRLICYDMCLSQQQDPQDSKFIWFGRKLKPFTLVSNADALKTRKDMPLTIIPAQSQRTSDWTPITSLLFPKRIARIPKGSFFNRPN